MMLAYSASATSWGKSCNYFPTEEIVARDYGLAVLNNLFYA